MADRVGTLSPRVAIVGAGWAGLAAAVVLADRGVPVSMFESSRSLGGRARRVAVDGIDLDNGQHILIGAYSETLALMRKVGADPERLLARMPFELRFASGFRLRAPALAFPANLLLGLLLARGLSLRQALAAMRFVLRLRSGGFRVEPDRSVAELLAAQGQHGAPVRYLWNPLCVSALNTPPEIASARVFANVLRDALTGARENSDLLLPRVDLGSLFPAPAADFVTARGGTIEFGAPVRGIASDGDGFRIDARAQRYSHVIVASAPQHAAALLAGFDSLEPVRRAIEALEYEPIFTCYLRYERALRLPSPMLGLDGPIGQWLFDRGRLGGEPGLAAVVMSASGSHQDMTQQDLAARIHAELKQAIPDLPELLWSRVIGEKRATFSCRPGVLRPEGATAVRGLYLAGDYVASDYPGTLEAAVRSGVRAAGSILRATGGQLTE